MHAQIPKSCSCSLLTVASLIIVLLSLAWLSPPAHAFKANEEGHEGITRQALGDISRTVDSETLRFTQRAINQIATANNRVDLNQSNAALHFDDEALDTGSSMLVALKEQVITSLLGDSADGRAARQTLGRALHTVQDFFAHSSAVETGFGIPDFGETVLGQLPMNVATCTGTVLNPGTTLILPAPGLTSGYFQEPLCDPPAGKCRHGLDFVCPDGLNKDSPSRPGYGTAYADAHTTTTNFANAILDDGRISGNAKAIKRLMDIRATLGMVIDDTGSMGPIISGVKSNVASIVASVRGTDDEPDQYLLQTFNDPAVGTTATFSNPDPFLAAVNAVSAGGGGDCPELAWSGTVLAVNVALTDSKLYLFTDASPKDGGLAEMVTALAKKKRTAINPLLFGSCSPFDQTYFDVAQATGGQVFILNRSEAGTIFNLVAPLVKHNVHSIMAARTQVSGTTAGYDVPIDDTLSAATFSVSMPTKGTITLRRPDGSVVQGGDAGVTLTELVGGRVYTAQSPAVGNWHLELTGTSSVSVSVDGITPLFLNTFDFAEIKGRLGHQALFPIDGAPLANHPVAAMAGLIGPYSTAVFDLRDPAGAVITSISMSKNNPDTGADKFVGNLTPPSGPFLVYVTGTTSAGRQFQRMLPGEILAATLDVRAPDAVDLIPVGTTTSLPFKVTNFGASAMFYFMATDDKGFIVGSRSGSVTLNTGESATIQVSVAPPLSTPGFTQFTVSLSVNQPKPSLREAGNSADIALLTQPPNRPPVCTAATSSVPTLWPPNHQFVDVNILGVTDPDGDLVSISITRITQDEAVDAPGSGHTAPDGTGIGTSIAKLRAERNGDGDGRIYMVGFTASDGRGGSCSGKVTVKVPHDQGGSAIDSGQSFDSTIVPPGF